MSKETEKGRISPVYEITGEGPETIHGGQFTGPLDLDKTGSQYHQIWDAHCTTAVVQMVILPFLSINSSSLKSHVKT